MQKKLYDLYQKTSAQLFHVLKSNLMAYTHRYAEAKRRSEALDKDILRLEQQIRETERQLKALEREGSKAKLEMAPRLLSLRDACQLVGKAHNTVKNDRRLQPKGGIPDIKLGNTKRYWKQESIDEWASVTKHTRDAYLRKHILNSTTQNNHSSVMV